MRNVERGTWGMGIGERGMGNVKSSARNAGDESDSDLQLSENVAPHIMVNG